MKTSEKIMLIISVLWIPFLFLSFIDWNPSLFLGLALILFLFALIGWGVVAMEKIILRNYAKVVVSTTVLFILSFLVGVVWLWLVYVGEDLGWLIYFMAYGIYVIGFAAIVVVGWIIVGIISAIEKLIWAKENR